MHILHSGMRSFISYVGLGTLLWFMVKAVRFTFSVRLSKSSLARYMRGDETWALVTGGSDGMASLLSGPRSVITIDQVSATASHKSLCLAVSM